MKECCLIGAESNLHQGQGTRSRAGYRPDIDGLRGLAILLIVVFHASPSSLPGGFIGVDIFFVISGFLITSTIWSEMREKQFRFLDFYARRIRRIFPALTVVLASSLAAGWLTLVDSEYKQLAKHTLGASFFISNFMFWAESGYFDTASETKILLHLWSLGVEEQFYILFPILLYAVYRLRLQPLLSLIVLALLSFSINLHTSSISPAADFFLPHNRVWELLVGAALAAMLSSREGRSRGWGTSRIVGYILGAIGVALIMLGLARTNQSVNFPGWIALLPVGGAALLIAAGSASPLSYRLLASSPATGLGRLSFSLYLWHWPLLVFPVVVLGQALPLLYRGALVLVSLLLAFITFHCVENPIRFGRRSRLKLFICLAGILLIILSSSIIFSMQGLPSRSVSISYNQLFKMSKPIPVIDALGEAYCPQVDKLPELLRGGCQLQYSPPNPTAKIVVWGDSHARSWAQPLLRIAERMRYDLTVLSFMGHPPLRGIHRCSGGSDNCGSIEHANQLFAEVLQLNPDAVVLAARWPVYQYGFRDSNSGQLNPNSHFLSSDMSLLANQDTSIAALKLRIPETVSLIRERGIGVILIESPPQLLWPWSGRRPGPGGEQPTLEEHKRYTTQINEITRSIPGLILIEPAQRLCSSGLCLAAEGSTRFYFDDNHLTYEGASLFESDLLRALSKATDR